MSKKTDCLTSSDGDLMVMAAHRGAMHQAPEDAEAFTNWYIDYVSPVMSNEDKRRLTRDTITDGFSTLWSNDDPALWVPLFLHLWESLDDNGRHAVDGMVAYTGRLGSTAYAEHKPSNAHGMDDDDGCPGRLPTDHPLEGAIGQRMIINMHRYCLGRMTYMPATCRDWLREWWHYVELDTRFKILTATGQALLSGGCGMDCDASAWLIFFLKGLNELDDKGQKALKKAVLKGGASAEDLNKMLAGDFSKGVFKWTHSS